MPFISSSESMRSKAHATDLGTPVVVGLLVLAVLGVVLIGGNVISIAATAPFAWESSTGELLSSGDSENVSSMRSSSSEEASVKPELVYVFVSGSVKSPGVYALPSDARVGDAVSAAGGFTDEAATEYNNLARVVVDGEQIHVPTSEEVAQGQDLLQSGAATRSGATPGFAAGESNLVNINTADSALLETLPGIGPATAQKIIASRESEGPFASTDELMRISGIGDKKYAAIKDLICV